MIFSLFLKTEHNQIGLAIIQLDSSLTTFFSEVCHINADRQILGQAALAVEPTIFYILENKYNSV